MAQPLAFCSYSRADAAFALRLAEDLKTAGANVWLDQIDIEPGTPWDRAVEQALAAASRILVILPPSSVRSDNVSDELSFALSKRKRIIPVLYLECEVPFRLARLQHIDFTHDYDRGLKALIKTLSAPPAEVANSGSVSETANHNTISKDAPETKREQTSSGKIQAPPRAKYPAWMKIVLALCVLLAVAFTVRWALHQSSDQSSKTDQTNSSSTAKQDSPSSLPDAKSSNQKFSPSSTSAKPAKSPPASKSASAKEAGNANQMARAPDQFKLAASQRLISEKPDRYAYQLWIQAPADFLERIDQVRYDLIDTNEPMNATSANPNGGFGIHYDGWGCYPNVDVTVTFKNADPPAKKNFNMCSAIGQ
jgi:hypothetical protein